MTRNLERLMRPRHLAVIGGGAWCEAVIKGAEAFGFAGEIHAVHPKRAELAGLPTVPDVAALPAGIDASFIGVNREATIEVVRALNAAGAGGAVCFAAGYSEAVGEDETASVLQGALVDAAGEMALLGPNCYGFLNALDRVSVWPDQHGLKPVEQGVAILTQSSNISINLTMQRRGLPIAYMVTCGNQAQTRQADIALTVLEDPRVTCLGLHIEGFGDVAAWVRLAQRAAVLGKPIIALKVGRSEQARVATVSHTASLAGGHVGASALMRRLGMIETDDLAVFLETLKLVHVTGGLDTPTLSSISCSGGEASLVADMAEDLPVDFPALQEGQKQALKRALGPLVALANPLDYNTYIWRDTEAMTAAWAPMAAEHIGLTMSIVDYPWTDARDWTCATDAALRVRAQSGRPFAVTASLPELMPGDVAEQLIAGGVVPFCGLREALSACALVAHQPDLGTDFPLVAVPVAGGVSDALERDAKRDLNAFGLDVPHSWSVKRGQLGDLQTDVQSLAMKSQGIAHKSEAGGVKLGLRVADLAEAARGMPGDEFLIEAMVEGGVTELLVGVLRDPPHGFVLTLGAGGVMTEILGDTASLLVPASRDNVKTALQSLRIWPLIDGFRGKPAADLDAILDAIDSVQSYVQANTETLVEVEVNPLICTPSSAVAADALIRKVMP